MASARRRRNLVSSRRRVQDEGDEDDGTIDVGDDSQSEGSVLTGDENLDADDSELSDAEAPRAKQSGPSSPKAQVNGNRTRRVRKNQDPKKPVPNGNPEPTKAAPTFATSAETDAMVNGIAVDKEPGLEHALHFDEAEAEVGPTAGERRDAEGQGTQVSGKRDGATQHRTREQDEYKARRDADPAVVPNRGGFFMHDQRLDFGHPSRGRGRGRGFLGNGHPNSRPALPQSDMDKARWDHDLHETLLDPKPTEQKPVPTGQPPTEPSEKSISSQQSLSKSVLIGTVLVRVFLPSMKEAITIDKKLTVKQHTRLPDLRPPLRRDKPVRISLPNQAPRYIFPSTERSFIFIPRAQRPNQQGAKNRNRGYFSQAGSRRTSVYAGSAYTPSVAMSRRSSQVRDGIASPVGSLYSRPPPGAPTAPSRPVVKLPIGIPPQAIVSPSNAVAVSGSGTPLAGVPHGPAYPLPSQPAYREHRSSQIPMHQPRPQKQVSVATIESPEPLTFHAPQQQEQQPFHHQVPFQYSNPPAADPSGYSQGLPVPFHGQPSGGTPLSNIPEGAINAQPFQPTHMQQPGFYSFPMQPMYYYPTPPDSQPGQFGGQPMASPVYIQQGPYYVPMLMPMQTSMDDPSASGQQGMFAHESNGMVYYYDPSQFVGGGEGVAPAGYADPAARNMMSPASHGFYPAQNPADMVYYPPQ